MPVTKGGVDHFQDSHIIIITFFCRRLIYRTYLNGVIKPVCVFIFVAC